MIKKKEKERFIKLNKIKNIPCLAFDEHYTKALISEFKQQVDAFNALKLYASAHAEPDYEQILNVLS